MVQTKQRILIVDDEEKFLNSIRERVQLQGYEPLTAGSGQEALEIARKTKIDMAVVDLRMPDMDGLVTITKLKEIQPGIKTVLLTAYGDDKLKETTEALNSTYFEKQDMGGFWAFLKGITGKHLTVLVVDDEEKFLNTTAERIRIKGFKTFMAGNGQQAIEIARKNRIDLAVVDLRMPDMDGLVTITKLKEIHPKIRTVLLTAYGDEKLKETVEALNSSYFEKQNMGAFWNFMKRVSTSLEDTMAAAGMATGGDLDEAARIEQEKKKHKSDE